MTPPHAAAFAEAPSAASQQHERTTRPDLTVIIGEAGVAETVTVEQGHGERHVPLHLLPRVSLDGVTHFGATPTSPGDFTPTSPR